MIRLQNVQSIDGKKLDHLIESKQEMTLNASGLTLFPALIDPHVHFRVPGAEQKENWITAAHAAIAGGVTTVLDMPNNSPSCNTEKRLQEKKVLIERQLQDAGVPLRYGLYFGVDQETLEEIPKIKDQAVALKFYMGSSTGDLLIHDTVSLNEAFELAAENDLLAAIHAEDEELIQANKKKYVEHSSPAIHSKIRSPEVAARAVEEALDLAEKHGVRTYIVHVSTREELALIRAAKKKGLKVYAEAAPHHLFLTTDAYKKLGTLALVNPPLRSKRDVDAMWEAIEDGTIDTIGTDHAPHTLEEKKLPYGKAPSGFPSIETYFPLLLNAYHEKKISLEKIILLTHTNPQEIFRLKPNSDAVLVDLDKKRTVSNSQLKTKAGWSPYEGMTLQGWPRFTIVKGEIFEVVS